MEFRRHEAEWEGICGPVTGKWLAQVFGDVNGKTWEISVIRESYQHGRISYGWFNENKLLISHNHMGVWRLAPGLGPMLVEVAERFAEHLNAQDALKAADRAKAIEALEDSE